MSIGATAQSDIGSEPLMRLSDSVEEAALRAAVAETAARFGHDYFVQKTHAGESPTELWKALGQAGYLGASIPQQYGGGGHGVWALAIVAEELAAAGCPMLPLVFSQSLCGSILARHGSLDQQQRWLGGIASGEMKFSFALTEPDAGLNSHNLRTTARRDGAKYVLSGIKTFISGVEDAEAIMVVAKTGTGERTGGGQLSLFVIDPDAPGLTRQRVPTAIEAPEKQWTLFFDDVVLGADRLVGQEGRALRLVFEGLNPERILGATLSIGIGRYALDRATRYATEHSEWGRPIGEHQGVAHPLAKAKIELELARLMTRKAATLFEAGHAEAGEAANMAKYAAAEASVQCVEAAIQAHGDHGLDLQYGVADMWWLARLTKIAPVSTEMVLNFVAEHSLGLGKSY